MSKKCILVITDGIGANPDKNDASNAFMRAKSLLMTCFLKRQISAILKPAV